jgi:hypothetical protein
VLFRSLFPDRYEFARVPYLETSIWQATTRMNFVYYFVNWSEHNLTSPPSLYPPDKYRRIMHKALANGSPWHWGVQSTDLLAKLIFPTFSLRLRPPGGFGAGQTM